MKEKVYIQIRASGTHNNLVCENLFVLYNKSNVTVFGAVDGWPEIERERRCCPRFDNKGVLPTSRGGYNIFPLKR